MARLRQDFPFCIPDHQTEGVFLDLDAAVGGGVDDGTAIVCRTGPGCRRCLRLERVAQHHIVLVRVCRHYRRGQHADPHRPRRDKLYLNLQIRIVLVRRVGEVEHLHSYRPVAVQVESLARTQAIALPLHRALALGRIKGRKRVGKEVSVRKVAEVCRHVFLHTLQVLHACVRLNLRIGGGRQQYRAHQPAASSDYPSHHHAYY